VLSRSPKVDPGAIASAVALGVLLLLLAADIAHSFVPVAAGAVRVLAPAMRTMLANATEGAVTMAGTTAVRATVRQAANVGGMGAMVTVSRTASRDSMAKALAGLAAAAAGIAAVVDDAADQADCDFTTGGIACADPVPRVPGTVFCGTIVTINGVNGFPTRPAVTGCYATAAEWASAYRAQYTGAGFSVRNESTSTSGTSVGWSAQVCSDFCTSSTHGIWASISRGTTSTATEFRCAPGSDASRLSPGQCRSADSASWPTDGASSKLYQRLKDRDGWLTPSVAQGVGQAGGQVPEVDAPTRVEEVEPAVIPLPATRRTWLLPDGTEVVEEVRPEYVTAPDGDAITFRRVDRRTVTPPGAAIPSAPPVTEETILPPGADPGTVTPPLPDSEPVPEPREDLECGLPGTPPCKIDETGTPTGEDFPGPAVIDSAVSGVMSCVTSPLACLPALPALSWSFALPSGCSAFPVTGFGSWITEIDVCEFQPVFHDLMSVVWVLGGLFGAIGLFWRKTLSH
jgi:hypothetical protein